MLDSVVAALFGFPPLGAACTLPFCALSGASGDATMTYIEALVRFGSSTFSPPARVPDGREPTSKSARVIPDVWTIRAGVLRGSGPYNALGRAGAPLGAAFAFPVPMPQGLSYVH